MDLPLRPPEPVERRESVTGLLLATVSPSTPASRHAATRAAIWSRSCCMGFGELYGGSLISSRPLLDSFIESRSPRREGGCWNIRSPAVLGELMFNSMASARRSKRLWHRTTSSASVPEMLIAKRVPLIRLRAASICAAAASSPLLGKPMAFRSDSSAVSRTNRGWGLPRRGSRVTVPQTTYPKPRAASEGRRRQSLSKPAANPTGFRNFTPHHSVSSRESSTLRLDANAAQILSWPRAKPVARWAASGGNRNRKGRATRLYRRQSWASIYAILRASAIISFGRRSATAP